ncbi:MAG: hypothetical protein Q7K21_03860 [Elusimicrobiota bacterium]|nr:hypothetical protein [Elusimicrobiota bacterium]
MKKNKSQFLRETKTIYKTENTITIPVEVFETADTKEEIEDWLLAHDSEFIERMRKAKADMDAGKGITLEELKKRLCIK